jgi:NADH:ubiquinone oxidoreductase subunit 5 (subunit L)/multisubunit Na+/H+ antiporter MnhA subunit
MIDSWFVVRIALALAILAPLVSVLLIGTRVLLWRRATSEQFVTIVVHSGLLVSVGAGVVVLAGYLGMIGAPVTGDIEFGDWLRIREFRIPAVLLVDHISITIALFASVLTALVARFSRPYLHKEPGFTRFFVLLGLFATGTQLVALAGALELFFAGWELIGISSAFFIGFFHERDEPVRSSVRAFATYRFSDAGLLIATVMTFESLGSARFSALDGAATLPAMESTAIALLFLLSAMGKSAQLPFSGWLPRAMEGPTPSSALFYGAVSIHAGLFLLLRVWPVLDCNQLLRCNQLIKTYASGRCLKRYSYMGAPPLVFASCSWMSSTQSAHLENWAVGRDLQLQPEGCGSSRTAVGRIAVSARARSFGWGGGVGRPSP